MFVFLCIFNIINILVLLLLTIINVEMIWKVNLQ